MVQGSDERAVFLSTRPATPFDRKLAAVVVAISTVLFLAAVPFASLKLPAVPAFVSSYQFALATSDLITAILLYTQFSTLRSRALLLLASGYLFTAITAVIHALTFPGLFSSTGLFNAGSQTTVWLYMVWHGGFPILALGYALLKDSDGGAKIHGSAHRAVFGCIVAVCVATVAVMWAVTSGHDFLPTLLRNGRYTPAMIGVVSSVWLLSLAALIVLWRRRPHSILDVWLMVVMCVWLFDIALSAILNEARFDLGFYAGRIYGLLAANFVLGILLVGIGTLHAHLFRLLDTVRRQAASALDRQAEERRHIFESSQDLILVTDPKGTLVQASPSAEAILGYSPEYMVGRNAAEFIHADDIEHTREEMRAARRGLHTRNFQARHAHKDGRFVELTWIGTWSDPVQRHFFIGRDMTASRKAQEELLDSEQLARGIIDTALDGFIQMDEAGQVLDWNSQAEKIFGWSRQEVLGTSLEDLIVPEASRESYRKHTRQFLNANEAPKFGSRLELGARRRDGKEVRIELSVTALRRQKGVIFNAFVRDLTEKIAAEDRFRQAQKMEAVGQLTGGIAHDFNNILTVITGTIEMLAEGVQKDPQLSAIAKMIDDAADRGAELTKHLLAFARKQPLQPRETDVNALIVETTKLLRPTLGEQIEIECAFEEKVCSALVDPNQLATAIINLAVNARDAMPGGGKLVLETGDIYLDESYASVHSDVTPGRYILIAVSDTGTGIPKAALAKVFDPFFTLKEPGKGTGLGLSMVYGFVKQSTGHIQIYSEEGHGTTVKIYLPPATAISPVVGAAPAVAISGGNESILVVEDDALVRGYVVTQLRTMGYATLAAANAAEALAIVDAGHDIDLLFTDVIMPGEMNGRQLADEVQKRRPSQKTLFTSGYTENAIIHHGRLDLGVLLLAKPYRKSDLARMVRQALSANGAA